MNCIEAKKIDIIITLRNLGHNPIRETEKEAWFLSPFRTESDPSFKVNKQKNVFYDFGIGLGGNLIDLLAKMLGSVKNALDYLNENKTNFSFHQQVFESTEVNSSIKIDRVKTIQHFGLIDYLKTRQISISTARSICKEVHFHMYDKKYFSIGLKNISKGWELRNKYFKSGSSPKDISLIKNNSTTLIVTEGMFDMLSLLEFDNSLIKKADLMILNSCSFHEKLMNYKIEYDKIHLYLDHDDTGRNITDKYINEQMNFQDCSKLYIGYNDVNEWWVNKNEI
ncbi:MULTISPECIES: toprim domain-containing protein [Maribacter]|uniref:toprim domain-containing protein n=1 Tax=Maribacter TaxID=252356 RepID=UPI001B18ABCD|nr:MULTISPECIES: toprim domain-containing protein [Maribacter]MDO6470251.1 toprim domain-containing protein [Maribacter sp. 1_MG-2023]CAG2531783.1 CHC2 zinc finger [Maribacter dokdonensis]